MESGTLSLTSPLRREGLCLLMRDAPMQYRHGVGHAPAKLVLRSEGLYQSKAFAPMQYRHGIGHAPANFAFAADTKRKTSVPLFFASTGGLRLPSSMPILHQSLQFIDCYSPSLRRFASTGGLGLPSSMPILQLSLQFIDCYSPQLHRFSASNGLRLSLLQTYYTSVASSYWFLQFFVSQVC